MLEKNTKVTRKRKIVGEFLGFSGLKTIKVRVERKTTHPKYKKIIKKFKNYLVHFEGDKETLKIGDSVLIQECKPISKRKSWIFLDILNTK